MKKVIYWSPHINPQIATVSAVLNSAKSLLKYGKEVDVYIINVFGEWNKFKNICKENNIQLINLTSLNFSLPINGFIRSRFFYIFISLISVFKLPFIINKIKPNYFILHLIVIPVMFISLFYKCKPKFILRISGLPKFNLFRKNIWKLLSKNLNIITCPTLSTFNQVIKLNILNKKKIILLEDPIINIRQLPKKRVENLDLQSGFILSVGRLTYQKNFEFLIKNFSVVHNQIKKKLLIVGSGENKDKLNKLIIEKKAEKFIKIIDYQENIHKFFKNADCFVLTSRWEDPGFVLIEAAINNLPILTSNCPNGPKEFIQGEINGYSYSNGNGKEFQEKLLKLVNEINSKKMFEKKISAKKYTRKFTTFSHYLKINKILK